MYDETLVLMAATTATTGPLLGEAWWITAAAAALCGTAVAALRVQRWVRTRADRRGA